MAETQTQLTKEQSQSEERFAPPTQPERRASQSQPNSDIQMTEDTRNESQDSAALDTQSKSEENKEQQNTANTATNGQSAASTVKLEEPEAGRQPFSWLKPHAQFVVPMVGPQGNEVPFAIHRDLLAAQSGWFRREFAKQPPGPILEAVLRGPFEDPEIFGHWQNYLYTGLVGEKGGSHPSYEVLLGLWKLGLVLEMDKDSSMFDAILAKMKEVRATTQRIPSTPLLISVWEDTKEDSPIRKLLLQWSAEYIRASDSRADFVNTLPQHILGPLVILLNELRDQPATDAVATPTDMPAPKKNVHYLDGPDDEPTLNQLKRSRRVSGPVGSSSSQGQPSPAGGRSRSMAKPAPRRKTNSQIVGDRNYTTAQKLEFCADLLARMLSGPGFWTRLVGPFKEPVNPSREGVPDYLDKVKHPMDLSTIKGKMDRREYANEEEFLADMRQIFENCFLYWKKGAPMYAAGEKLQRTFEEKFLGMNKWIAKMGAVEGE